MNQPNNYMYMNKMDQTNGDRGEKLKKSYIKLSINNSLIRWETTEHIRWKKNETNFN